MSVAIAPQLVHPQSRAADAIAATLAAAGVEVVFGIPGGTISPVNDALLDQPTVQVRVCRHESEAVFAACGHAMVSGGVGVVFVTSGPGLTNALTGLAAARCDGVPLVILVGEVPRPLMGRGALQDGSAHHLDVRHVTQSLTKGTIEVADARQAAGRVAEALHLARDGRRGPMVVTLPLDVLTTAAPTTAISFASGSVTDRFDDETLEDACVRLGMSARPLLVAGSGMRQGRGPEALLAFAEAYQIPVVTTPKAKGVFPETHPLSLGVYGIGGHPSAQAYVARGIDALFAVGTSLGDLATDGFSAALKPRHSLVHVDLDPGVIGRSYPADLGVVGCAAAFMRAMLARRPPAPRAVRRFGVRTHTDPTVDVDATAPIKSSRAVVELQAAMPKGTRFVIDSGEHFLFAAHYLRLERPDQFIAMTGLGAMGSSLGVAMGSMLAQPHRPVAVIIGDGGFSMVGLELMDAVAWGTPLVVMIMNDARLGMCELGHDIVYGRVPSFDVPGLDMLALTASLGAEGHVIEHATQIEALADRLRAPTRPIVLDVRVDRDEKLPKRDRIGALGQDSSKS